MTSMSAIIIIPCSLFQLSIYNGTKALFGLLTLGAHAQRGLLCLSIDNIYWLREYILPMVCLSVCLSVCVFTLHLTSRFTNRSTNKTTYSASDKG